MRCLDDDVEATPSAYRLDRDVKSSSCELNNSAITPDAQTCERGRDSMIQISTKARLVLTASLAIVSAGCQSDFGSRWRLHGVRPIFGHQRKQCQSQYARIQPEHSLDQVPPSPSDGEDSIPFGHSTDFGLQYAPEPADEPTYPAPPAPIPAQPAPIPSADELPPRDNPDIPSSRGNAPIIEEDARLRSLPVPPRAEAVRETAEPERLSPFSVRSIYERLRPGNSSSNEVEDGPIASRNMLESATRVVDFRNTTEHRPRVQPVTLGQPETGEVLQDQPSPKVQPPVMQATPSSYRHPMLADPTGMPYGVIN